MRHEDEGTVTLANGQTRRAAVVIGSFTGERLVGYFTPAGYWRLAGKAEAATYRSNGEQAK